MKDIYLTPEQYSKLPYKSSELSKGESYGNIVGLFEKYNIQGYRFTKTPEGDIWEFPIIVQKNGVDYPLKVTLNVPRLWYPIRVGRGKNKKKEMTYLESTSWRIFYWYLKSKLEAISYGISDELEEFMYHVTYQIEDKGVRYEVSLGQQLINNVDNLNNVVQLEDKRERKVV